MTVGSFPGFPDSNIVRIFMALRGGGAGLSRSRHFLWTSRSLYCDMSFSIGQSVALNEDGSLMATGSVAAPNLISPGPDRVRVYNLISCILPRILPFASIFSLRVMEKASDDRQWSKQLQRSSVHYVCQW